MSIHHIAKWAVLGLVISSGSLRAQHNDTIQNNKNSSLIVGGYGEAVYTRNFYSDNMFRYSHAERYKKRQRSRPCQFAPHDHQPRL